MSQFVKIAALMGMIGPPVFGATLLALTFLEYDFMLSLGWTPLGLTTSDWPSGLALGPYGSAMTVAFLFNGLCVAWFALGLRRVLPATRLPRAAAGLLFVSGLAMMGLAFPTDPTVWTVHPTINGRLHDAAFICIGCTLLPALLIFSRVFRQIPGWSHLAGHTLATGVLAVPTFALKGAAFYFFLGAVIIWNVRVAWRLKLVISATS